MIKSFSFLIVYKPICYKKAKR